jgi:hypothetical protein
LLLAGAASAQAFVGTTSDAAPGGADSASRGETARETIARIRATDAEERWRLIPWRDSLVEAFAVARKERKPVFFFGYDGILDTGNC